MLAILIEALIHWSIGSCVAKVQDDIKDNYSERVSLVDLPTELLVKILFYLSAHEIIMIRYVCQRFRDVSETLLLWKIIVKKFVWCCRPCHVCMVSNVLKVYGEHVRHNLLS